MKTKDETGSRFGRWTVIRLGAGPGRWKTYWLCRCDCGNEKTISATSLRSGSSTSCGCFRSEFFRKHGQSGGAVGIPRSAEYETWHLVIQRCTNPKATKYASYGGSGVTVCDRWRESFEAFLADMGPKPTSKHSIDRIKNSVGYEPGNCRWATAKEQARNTRSVKLSPEKVAEIRRRRLAGETNVALGAEFGVHHSVISRVANGRTWA